MYIMDCKVQHLQIQYLPLENKNKKSRLKGGLEKQIKLPIGFKISRAR